MSRPTTQIDILRQELERLNGTYCDQQQIEGKTKCSECIQCLKERIEELTEINISLN